MRIFLTNDDGYQAKGIATLSRIMQQFGPVKVLAPKYHQSGMAMAVSIGIKRLAYKHIGEKDGADWSYLDATPASCVKFALNYLYPDGGPDLILCGINHGSNASTAALYSGTLGATAEACLNGITAIGVSLDTINTDADFSAIERFLPGLIQDILSKPSMTKGVYYNINFPKLKAEEIKGVRCCCQGRGRWIKEFIPWDPERFAKWGITKDMFGGGFHQEIEDGESVYMMSGQYVDDSDNPADADNLLLAEGFITVTAHNIYTTDTAELQRLRACNLDKDFSR